MRVTAFAAVAALFLATPVTAQEALNVPWLLQAVDADAATWSATVERCVTEFGAAAVTDRHVVDALGYLLRAEELRPVGADVPLPDAETLEQIRTLLTSADEFLGRHLRGEVYRFPAQFAYPPAPPPPGVEPPPPGPTPLALRALVDTGLQTDGWMVAERILVGCRWLPYQELAPLVERAAIVWHHQEAVEVIAQGRVRSGHVEAAGLLLLIHQRGWIGRESGLVTGWERWSDERVARGTPYMIAKCAGASDAGRLVRAFTQMTGRELPELEPWSLQRHREIYQAARDVVAELDDTLPPLIDPDWDPDAEVVAVLRGAWYETTLRAQIERVQDPAAEPRELRVALQRLLFEDTDESRAAVEEQVRVGERWLTIAWSLDLVEQLSPEWAAELRSVALDRLLDDPEGAARLTEAIFEAKERRTIETLVSLTGAVDAAQMTDAFGELALAHRDLIHNNEMSFYPLRNAICAWGMIDHAEAAEFFLWLLSSDSEAQRNVGIFAVGELGAAEAVPGLVALMVPEEQHAGASSIITALGKIDADVARDAIIEAIAALPEDREYCSSVTVVACRGCGINHYQGDRAWRFGMWGVVAPDVPAFAARVLEKIDEICALSTNEQIVRSAQNRAEMIRNALARPGRTFSGPPPPPPAPPPR